MFDREATEELFVIVGKNYWQDGKTNFVEYYLHLM